ncbi:MAG: aminodeoxychorismate/anthranilate synthase component II [Fimbriimonadaceae bacterium]
MILVIDNYDSFTYNLVQYLGQCGEKATVVRNDAISLQGVVEARPTGILLSPGPCSPESSGVCLDILAEAFHPAGRLSGVPIFGVCLGYQAMGLVSGAKIRHAATLRHGKTSPIEHDGKGVFAGCPSPLTVTRYHSLAIGEGLSDDFEPTATALDDQELMAIRHRILPIEGVQFHPESITSEHGLTIVGNFVQQVRSARMGSDGPQHSS